MAGERQTKRERTRLEGTRFDGVRLDGTRLKGIALVTMAADHFAVAFLEPWAPVWLILRLVGRIAFPLYCFLLVEGFCHTRSVGKYMARLGVFALISELPFDWMNGESFLAFGHQNVFFTLLFGLAALWGMVYFLNRQSSVGAVLWCGAAAALAGLCRTDYGATGVILIVLLYYFREDHGRRFLLGYAVLILGAGIMEFTAAAGFGLMETYNGERGRGYRLLFYWFYPLHLLVFAAVRWLLNMG